MAAIISNPATVLVLNPAEASAVASLLYALQAPETLARINAAERLGLGANQCEDITQLWGRTFGTSSIKA